MEKSLNSIGLGTTVRHLKSSEDPTPLLDRDLVDMATSVAKIFRKWDSIPRQFQPGLSAESSPKHPQKLESNVLSTYSPVLPSTSTTANVGCSSAEDDDDDDEEELISVDESRFRKQSASSSSSSDSLEEHLRQNRHVSEIEVVHSRVLLEDRTASGEEVDFLAVASLDASVLSDVDSYHGSEDWFEDGRRFAHDSLDDDLLGWSDDARDPEETEEATPEISEKRAVNVSKVPFLDRRPSRGTLDEMDPDKVVDESPLRRSNYRICPHLSRSIDEDEDGFLCGLFDKEPRTD